RRAVRSSDGTVAAEVWSCPDPGAIITPSGRMTAGSDPCRVGHLNLTLETRTMGMEFRWAGLKGEECAMSFNVPSIDQRDRIVPINLRQSGPTPVEMLIDTRVRKSPYWALSMEHGCWRWDER